MQATPRLSQIIINLLPVPNIAVHDQVDYTDDAGKLVASTMLPGRDLQASDVEATALKPLVASQQARIAEQDAQHAADVATIAARDARIVELEAQLAAALAPTAPPASSSTADDAAPDAGAVHQ